MARPSYGKRGITVWVDQATADRFADLAASEGLSTSGVLRHLIFRALRERERCGRGPVALGGSAADAEESADLAAS